MRLAPALHVSRALVLAFAVALFVLACGSPVVAPEMSTITLSADPTTISISGTTTITATVTAPSGATVENGTEVSFETDLGALLSPHAHTSGGKAVTKLQGREQSGTATVVASSGSVRSDGIQIVIGGAISVTLTADSTTPALDDTVTFTATPSAGSLTIDHYNWDFGDPARGALNTKTTTTGSATYIYITTGQKTVTVTAVATDGSSATTTLTVTVQ